MIPCTFTFNTHQLECYKNFSILPNKKLLFYVLISVTVKWILCKLFIKHHLCKRFYNRENPCMSSGPTAGQLKSIKLGKLINTDLNFCSWHSAIYRNFPLETQFPQPICRELRKLSASTKFPDQEIRLNKGILCSVQVA